MPRSLSSWQLAVLQAIPTAYPTPLPPATTLTLSPPHYFGTLYVPGMLGHMQLLWTAQSMLVWDRVRQLAARPSELPRAAAAPAVGASPLGLE